MFRYVISPKNKNKPPLILGFDITPEKITGYFQKGLSSNTQHFEFCAQKYFDKHRSDDELMTYVRLFDKNAFFFQHRKLTNKEQKKFVKNFLYELKNCEKIKKIDSGNEFFTDDVIADIINQFQNFRIKQNRFTSNDPDFLNEMNVVKLSPIFHDVKRVTSSAPNAAFDCLSTDANSTNSYNWNHFAQIGTIALIGIGLGLFAKNWRHPAPFVAEDLAKQPRNR